MSRGGECHRFWRRVDMTILLSRRFSIATLGPFAVYTQGVHPSYKKARLLAEFRPKASIPHTKGRDCRLNSDPRRPAFVQEGEIVGWSGFFNDPVHVIRDGRSHGGIGVTTFELELDPTPDAQGVGIALCTVGGNWMKLTMKWTMKWTKTSYPWAREWVS